MTNRIYAYTTEEVKNYPWEGSRKGAGLIKVGQTIRDTEERVRRQFQGSPIILLKKLYTILVDIEALDSKGVEFSDSNVFQVLENLGYYRLPGTEWFEMTTEELLKVVDLIRVDIVKAIKDTAPTRDKARKIKDMGNDEYLRKCSLEKAAIVEIPHIINVMKAYDVHTMTEITSKLMELYNVEMLSLKSCKIYCAEVIKKLVGEGLIRREGTFQMPYFYLNSIDKSIEIREDVSFYKPNYTVDDFVRLINTKVYGMTIKELCDVTGYSSSKIHNLIDHSDNKLIKVAINDTSSEFNGRLCRVFTNTQTVTLPENEEALNDKVEYTYNTRDINKICKIVKSYSSGWRTLKSLGAATEMSLDKLLYTYHNSSKLQEVLYIQEHNDLMKEDYKVIYAKHKDKLPQVDTTGRPSTILRTIKQSKCGLTTEQLAEEMSISNTKSLAVTLNALVEKGYILKRKVRDNGAPLRYCFFLKEQAHANYEQYGTDNTIGRLVINISAEDILSIIEKNPFISSMDIAKELTLLYPMYSISSFSHIISATTRKLIKEEKIVNARLGSGNRFHINDGSVKHVNVISNLPDVCYNIVTLQEYGCTAKEVAKQLGGIRCPESIYAHLIKHKDLEKRKIYVNGKSQYKFYLKGKVKLREGEVDVTEI